MKLMYVFGMGILRIFQSFFNKSSSGYLHSTKMYLRYGLYFECMASIFAFGYLLVEGAYGLDAFTLLCAFLSGAGFLFELLTSLKALQGAPLALCTMCSLGGGVILPTIAGIYFFDEPMHIFAWLGVLLFFMSAGFLMPGEKKKVSLTGLCALVLLLNFLINGALSIIGKFFATRAQNGNAALFACLSYVFAALLFAVVFALGKKDEKSVHEITAFPKKLFFIGTAVGFVCASIVYFSTILSRTIPIVVLNTIPNAVCLVGSLALEVFIFKGKFTTKKLIGVILSVISTTIIVLF